MKTSVVLLSELIGRLNHFAEQGFPVQEVGQFMWGRVLSPQELEPYTFFDTDQYTRNLIHKSEAFELLAIGWQAGQESPVHGHEGEKCWSRVEVGTLRFTNYLAISTGDSLDLEVLSVNVGSPGHLDGPADIHKVENSSDGPAISLHLYSYPFQACDIYDMETHLTDRRTLEYYSQYGTRCQ